MKKVQKLKLNHLCENALDENPELVDTFKKLQYNVIYNLIFTATDDPVDIYVDTIIVHELGWGKINGFQKGIYYKNYYHKNSYKSIRIPNFKGSGYGSGIEMKIYGIFC